MEQWDDRRHFHPLWKLIWSKPSHSHCVRQRIPCFGHSQTMTFTTLSLGIDSWKRKSKPNWMKSRGWTTNTCGGHFGLCKFLTKLKIRCGGHATTLCKPKRTWCVVLSSTIQSMINVSRYQNHHSMLYGLVEN